MHYQPATSARVSGLCRPQVLPNELAMMTPWPDTMSVEDPRAMAMVSSSPRSCASSSVARRTGGPTAAVGVVAVGQGHGRAVAGDVPGIAFNAQAVTVAAQIAAAEASGRAADRPAVAGPSDHPAGTVGVSVAGRMPALRTARTAGGPGALRQTVGRGLEPRHEAAAGGPARMPALRGWAGGRPRTGRRDPPLLGVSGAVRLELSGDGKAGAASRPLRRG
jgi:hypothetical protein